MNNRATFLVRGQKQWVVQKSSRHSSAFNFIMNLLMRNTRKTYLQLKRGWGFSWGFQKMLVGHYVAVGAEASGASYCTAYFQSLEVHEYPIVAVGDPSYYF